MPATTNFLQFNPAVVNQETDSQYAADSQRSGGFGTDAIVPSTLLNKIIYQSSTFLAAFGQMMAGKGYTTSDASVSTLAAVLANLLTEADQVAPLIVAAYSPTPSFNAAAAGGFQMSLTGNVTSSSISGVSVGQLIAFYFLQDGVGGRTVAYPTGFIGAVQPDPAPNAVSVQLFRADLARTMRAVTPVISNNGMFTNAVTASSLSLRSGAPAGVLLAGNGSSFTPQGTARTVVGNSSYRIAPDGTKECWGFVTSPAVGSPLNSVALAFPITFTTPPQLFVNSVGLASNSGDSGTPPVVQVETLSVGGATIFMARTVVAGAGGGNFDNAMTINYYAIGN